MFKNAEFALLCSFDICVWIQRVDFQVYRERFFDDGRTQKKKKKKDKNQKNVLVCVCREAKKTANNEREEKKWVPNYIGI